MLSKSDRKVSHQKGTTATGPWERAEGSGMTCRDLCVSYHATDHSLQYNVKRVLGYIPLWWALRILSHACIGMNSYSTSGEAIALIQLISINCLMGLDGSWSYEWLWSGTRGMLLFTVWVLTLPSMANTVRHPQLDATSMGLHEEVRSLLPTPFCPNRPLGTTGRSDVVCDRGSVGRCSPAFLCVWERILGNK